VTNIFVYIQGYQQNWRNRFKKMESGRLKHLAFIYPQCNSCTSDDQDGDSCNKRLEFLVKPKDLTVMKTKSFSPLNIHLDIT